MARAASVVAIAVAACGSPRVSAPVAVPAPPERPAPVATLTPGAYIVQRETPLTLDGPEGPVIGRARRGARVRVVEVRGAWAELEVPGVHRPVKVEGGVRKDDLRAWIAGDDLGREPVALDETPTPGPIVRDHYKWIGVAPEGWGFAYTRCGELRVLERTHGSTKVAQDHGGIELVGWTDGAITTTRGDHRCQPRVAMRPTPGYAAIGDVGDADRALAAGRAVYWMVERETGFTCERWAIGTKELTRRYREDGVRVELSYGIERDGSSITLFGPSLRALERGPPDRGVAEWAAGCVQRYALLDRSGQRVIVMPFSDAGALVPYYHPDDAETWFLDAAACRSAVKAARAAIAGSPAPHTGC